MKTDQNLFFPITRQLIIILLVVFLIRTFGFGLYIVPTGSMEPTLLVGEYFFADKFSYLVRKPKHGDIITFNAPDFSYSPNRVKKFFQEYVWGPSNWTKRIIGIPGDIIKGTIENGKPVIFRNGKKLEEPYVNMHPLIALKQGEESIYKTYDPSRPFNQQPFYKIKPKEIVYNDHNSHMLKSPDEPIGDCVGCMTLDKNFWNSSDQFYVELDDNQYWVMGDNRKGSHDSRYFGPINGDLIHGKIVLRLWSIDSNAYFPVLYFLTHPIKFLKTIRWNRFFEVIV